MENIPYVCGVYNFIHTYTVVYNFIHTENIPYVCGVNNFIHGKHLIDI